MTRIALVTPILPVPFDQTRGRFIHETARSLAKIAEVKAFFQQSRYLRLPGLAPRTFLDGHVDESYSLPDLDVEAFSYPAFPVISRGINGHVSSLALTPRLTRFQPDIVLGYWVYPDGYGALLSARKLGLPCVIGALGSDIHVRSGLNSFMTRRTLAGADAVLTVSEAMRQTTIHEFGARPDKVHTIVNGFNTAIFHPRPMADMRAKLGIGQDEQVITFVGRFVEAKGLRELLAAFQQLSGAHPRLRLALIGDGVMREELRQLIDTSGLTSRVYLPGGLPPQQVAQWLCASDMLTLPSWSEGYPNVVVEAVACGRPVVATDVGGMREILNPNNGLMVPARQVDALRQALEKALSHPWDHTAIAKAMQRSWDDVARETLAVCEQVLSEHRQPA